MELIIVLFLVFFYGFPSSWSLLYVGFREVEEVEVEEKRNMRLSYHLFIGIYKNLRNAFFQNECGRLQAAFEPLTYKWMITNTDTQMVAVYAVYTMHSTHIQQKSRITSKKKKKQRIQTHKIPFVIHA